ncbi:bifunctional DNA-formamidopyrimidine glycosylase/DNA-(apurinic or apyrimidinic site) lyase [bacterium]|nr:bifunctional DNA-formamidopyrimidine glycosylase/DNA-(apurinic or apyrimidinic site) lyase [bacterium]
MPELPEVQTIVNDLNKKIKGDTIVGFWSGWKKAVKNISVKKFGEEIQGRKILGVRRVGKNIFIDLSYNKTIYIHLKMTGHLLVKFQNPKSKFQIKPKPQIINQKSKEEKSPLILSGHPTGQAFLKKGENGNYFDERVNQYVRHIFYLNQKSKIKNQNDNVKLKINSKFRIQNFNKTLEFSDLRKFGKIVLADTDKLESLKEIKSLGIDALSRKFTLKRFKEILKKRQNSLIGIILMNQNLIAGIGNIYRSEILFDAKILPTRKAASLKPAEIKSLYGSIKKILKKAVKMRGTSDSDYRDTAGAPGGFHKILKVYRREKQKCKKCDTMIKRIKLGQRSVYYCPNCQK